MSKSRNKVFLLGHLGADPETYDTANGSVVTNIRIATSETWRDKQSGEQKERTEWHRVVMFGAVAEVAYKHLKKGAQVDIEGRLQTRPYDKDGTKCFATEIVVQELIMLGSGKRIGSGDNGNSGDDSGSTEALKSTTGNGGGQRAVRRGAPGQASNEEPKEPVTAGDDDFDDDIPF